MYRFNSFTQKANDVLNLAIKAAENFGHTYIGSEHILIGVLKENTSYGAELLSEKGIALESVEQIIKDNTGLATPLRFHRMISHQRQKEFLKLHFSLQGE